MKSIYFILMVFILICCEGEQINCSLSVEPGVKLSVKNTNNEFIGDEVTAIVFDEGFFDTLKVKQINEFGEVTSLAGADERAGTYSLIIVSNLYKTFTDTNITVYPGGCHVKTVTISVILDHK